MSRATLHRGDLSFPEGVALEQEFEALAAEWKRATQYQSSLTGIAMHPAYQRIIGMGPIVLPLILRELDQTGGQWFWALQCVTGVDPVRPEDRGDAGAMGRAWMEWARKPDCAPHFERSAQSEKRERYSKGIGTSE